ncbi:HU family DNA-binding protein [uncultured Desulfovibrio sp.]|uniref:HU family DNA-binding protein n=1 Tax=uncultured Desulfovibrio sp. TaxID=167968 RepID=UPI002613BACE|nr:HU family DNA-binding protein [uncultured Desulfovibrio sp.]
MNKQELIRIFSEESNRSLAQARDDLNLLGDIMRAELLAGGEAPLPGVGRLVVRQTGARTVRNPQTGERIDVPAGRRIGFAPSGSMKEALKGE